MPPYPPARCGGHVRAGAGRAALAVVLAVAVVVAVARELRRPAAHRNEERQVRAADPWGRRAPRRPGAAGRPPARPVR
ncbi:hypothetical protein ACFPM0_08720 [Pseudonocardia sulfidoxydans]|uniref:hypothetical protein n=1 Tax=Pseudonocardia sulfidoxydans TaxID=54011 RepID=UPI00360B50CA